ncbi:restriction endonuclease [Methanoculleus sp. Afa-1]|uniref:site-specific DNA-methyltransferase (adenine-specific) n=1 Tax=Methanoculleus formosensis TaxID=2590886 RepID=A0A9E5DEH8_9EURY|nr:RNA-binding domain-containing protein [Methanoculleus sp. Afa-1]MCT8336600.1 restriction endonuclease [Methanoculleus sp. Afa-1]
MRGREQSFVRVSGGIVTEHFASLLQDEKHGFEYARPMTFVRPWREEDLPPQDEAQFLAQVRDVWERLLRRFDEKFRDILAGRMSAEEVRRLWQRPVLDALGFEPTSTTKQIVISDRLKYRFSHRGWFAREGIPKPPVIHILAPGTDPDVRPSRGEPSPHDALQDCLNRHDATWAVLMNETVIRILRDYHHTTVPGYVEFDLEGIFLNRSYPEFLALYRFCHASRFARDPATGREPLEEYYEVSRQAGEKIGESLRVNVVQAIEEFGNGFLDGALIERLRGDDGACRAYYQEVLMVVYRIIFMLFAEQRGMLGGGGDHGDLFLEEYSITSLRERVDAFEGRDDRNTDLWEGLSVTFRMLEEGVPELGVNAFDGMLFSNDGARFLKDAKCRNTALMNAIRSLTWTVSETGGRRQRGHGRQRISYADLSVEEIGAIYESLLDYTPRITTGFEEVNGREYRPGQFMLDPRGSERKTTGSYYTNPDLIAELIKSALDPVIADRLSRAGPDPAAREKALLSIRVCDPACGSGAFLIAASNRLGRELAKIRAGTELPSAQEVQAARRDVLAHCIYGVDLNPMAVELARVSLWINALVGDKPLSFLDHHIKCGNSLVGATPELIAGGIPDEAYTAVEGDSKEVAKRIKAANKEQRQTRTFEEFSARSTVLEACAGRFAALAEASEDDPDSVEAKKTEYERLIASSEYAKERLAADSWCAAFFWPLDGEHARTAPTTATVRMVQASGGGMLVEDTLAEVRRIANEHRFFHWHLEFPEVFADGGFDCVLGNPPWERIKIQEKEFFASRDPAVAGARNATERNRMITALKKTNPILYGEFLAAKCSSECESLFIRTSGRFPLTGTGDVNTYTVFAEFARLAINSRGWAGIIVPTGIATDATTAPFFGDLVEEASLVSLYDIENRKKFFPIDSRFKFCLLTMAGMEAGTGAFDLAFFLHTIDDLHDDDRHFTLTPEEILLINPNTKNCPIFRSKRDAEITKAVYRHVPVLIDETKGEAGNPWGVSFQRMFDMSNDSHLFRTQEEMEAAGFALDGNRFVKGEEVWLPLYEGKMVWHFDHRFSDANPSGNEFQRFQEIHNDTQESPLPRYWVAYADFIARTRYPEQNHLIGFRNISNTTNERTCVASILPNIPVGHSMPLIYIHNSSEFVDVLLYISSFIAYPLDYIIRQKMGGTNFTYHIIKQLPVLPPSTYTPALIDFIAPRVIELTYTARDLEPFARDVLAEVGVARWNAWFPQNPVGEDGTPRPFVWDEERRFDLRCDLDALYFHLYEISRDDVDYIMETFPIVKRKDEAKYGRYRTKEVILRKYDDLAREFVRVMRADLPEKDGKPDWRALIVGGESERVEFKESISWDRERKQRNKALEHTIARTLASFMNTHGGVLFVGVDDAGRIVGLDGDLKLSQRKNEDGLRLRFDDLVKQYLGNRFLPGIMIHSLEDSGKAFWAVEVRASNEPVFVKNNGDDEFWIRGSSSSRKLSMREAVEYIERRKSGGAGDPDAGEEE